MRRWIDVAWPVALLLLFAGTFRRGGTDLNPDAAQSVCDSPARLDAAALEHCLTLDPDNVELITDLGDSYAGRGDARRAETLYRQGLSIDPHDGDVHLRLGELLLAHGDAASARAEGVAALAVQPGSLAAARLIERAAAAGAGQ